MAESKETDNVWRIRNVDDETRKKVKLYAVERGIGVAEALKELVERALGAEIKTSVKIPPLQT